MRAGASAEAGGSAGPALCPRGPWGPERRPLCLPGSGGTVGPGGCLAGGVHGVRTRVWGLSPGWVEDPGGCSLACLTPPRRGAPGLCAAVHLRETPDHALCHEVPPWPPRACRTARAQGGCAQRRGMDVPFSPVPAAPALPGGASRGCVRTGCFQVVVWWGAVGEGSGLFQRAQDLILLTLVIPQTESGVCKWVFSPHYAGFKGRNRHSTVKGARHQVRAPAVS